MTGETEGDKISMPAPHIYVERSLAIIKPDAIHKAEEIEDIILRSGFAVLQVKCYDLYDLKSARSVLLCLWFYLKTN